MTITQHAKQRTKERCGFNKKTVEHMATVTATISRRIGVDCMQNFDKFAEMVQKDMDRHFDNEIRKIFGISKEAKRTTSEDVISDINGMVAKMTTLIMCIPKNKVKLEKEELPPMTKIIPNSFLEDDKVYLITDEKLKASILEGMRLNKKLNPKRSD